MSALQVRHHGDALHLTLCRPAARNALDGELVGALAAAFSALPPGIRRVVLRGAGAAFCAGADLGWMARPGGDGPEGAVPALLAAVDQAEVVVMARAHGAALGGGLGLLCCCDAVVAEAGARFGLVEGRLGLVPAMIAPYVVARMGPSAARFYFTTAQRFDAAEALRLGLVHHVAADLDAAEALLEGTWAQSVAACGPRAVAEAKAVVREVAPAPSPALTRRLAARLARLRGGAEAAEGLAAFAARRPPRWP